MALRLTIENETSLPDGGPLTVEISGQRGLDIGRDQYLDWCLPDPTRTISGKHCEVRFRDGAYWLTDVSRNGTFVNRSSQRLQEPYRLRDGDRIEIGRYIVAVQVDGAAGSAAGPAVASAPAGPEEYWSAAGEAAPEISRKDLRPAREARPVHADFIDWAVNVPTASGPSPGQAPDFAPSPSPSPYPPSPAPSFDDMSWAQASPPPPPPAAPPVPSPRRPGAASGAGDWGEPPPPVSGPAWDVEPVPAPALASLGDDGANPWGAPPGGSVRRIPEPPAAPPPPPAPSGGGPLEAGPPPLAFASDPASAPPPTSPPPRPAPLSQPAPAAQPMPAGQPAPAGQTADLIARFAKGAGVPPEVFSWRDPGDLAEEIGGLVRLSAENLKQLLNARAETKRVARTANQTMIQALDNNPLKFSPTIEDALRIMFGRPSAGYLDARRALEQGFKDLKTHQVKTYSAMQHAIRILLHELDPDAIARSHEADKGIGGLIGSKKARLWDLYLTRWDTLTAPHEDGMVDAFMLFFAECYDRGEKGR